MDKLIIFLKRRANIFTLSSKNLTGIWSIPRALLVSRLGNNFVRTSSEKFDNLKLLDILHDVLAK